ncbi:MAG: hypothetical protein AB1611_05360 [bacterium]
MIPRRIYYQTDHEINNGKVEKNGKSRKQFTPAGVLTRDKEHAAAATVPRE